MQISIDIETLGSGPDAQITQIGMVSFDFSYQVQEAVEILNNEDRWLNLYVEDYQGSRDESNVKFWNAPEQAEAKRGIDLATKIPLTTALDEISAFVNSFLGKRANVWAYPPAFDLRVLRAAYKRVGRECPWHWRQEACLRTLVWTADRVPRNKFKVPDISSQGLVPHNALHDAVEQTLIAQGAYRALLLQAKE